MLIVIDVSHFFNTILNINLIMSCEPVRVTASFYEYFSNFSSAAKILFFIKEKNIYINLVIGYVCRINMLYILNYMHIKCN